MLVPLRGAEQTRRVPALGLGERHAYPRAEEPVRCFLEDSLGRGEEGTALCRQLGQPEAEAQVQVVVVVRTQLRHSGSGDLGRFEVNGIEVLVRDLGASELELASFLPVRLVGDGRPQHAEADLLAADFDLEGGLELSGALLLLRGQLAHEAVAREAPELAQTPVAVHCGTHRPGCLERGQIGMALVDRLDLECLLVAGEMEVVLLHQLCQEAVGLLPEAGQLARGRRPLWHGSVG